MPPKTKTSKKHGPSCKCPACIDAHKAAKAARKEAQREAWAKDHPLPRRWQTGGQKPTSIYSGGHQSVRQVMDIFNDDLVWPTPAAMGARAFLLSKLSSLQEYPKASDRVQFNYTTRTKTVLPVEQVLDRVYQLDPPAATRAAFDAFGGEVTYLWHGTPSQNINGIAREALIPSKPSRLLGPGVYLAPDQAKSMGYLGGFVQGGSEGYGILLLCAVRLGNVDVTFEKAMSTAENIRAGKWTGAGWVWPDKKQVAEGDRLQKQAKTAPWSGDHRYAGAGRNGFAYSGTLRASEYCVKDPRRVLPVFALVYKRV